MQGQYTLILLSTLLLMAIKVSSKWSRKKGLNVYNIELWHEMKSALNNNETYRSPKSHGSIEPNRRTFDILADILLCELMEDCDESSNEEQEISSTSTSSSSPQPTLPSSTPSTPITLPSVPSVSMSLESVSLVPTLSPLVNKSSRISDDYSRFPYVSHIYKLHKEQLSWVEAQKRCQEESAQLVVIENGAQYDSVMQLVKREMGGGIAVFHAGFQRESIAEPWQTVYGDRLSFEKWASCEANNAVGDENCGGFIFVPNGPQGFNYGACSLQYNFVCEKRPSYDCA